MMKPLYIAAFLVAVTLTYGLYSMKYEVQRLESKLLTLHSELASERKSTQVLRAEWSYLNSPERLEQLALRHLDLTPVSLHRMAAITMLPFKEVTSSKRTSTRGTPEVSWPLLQATQEVR